MSAIGNSRVLSLLSRALAAWCEVEGLPAENPDDLLRIVATHGGPTETEREDWLQAYIALWEATAAPLRRQDDALAENAQELLDTLEAVRDWWSGGDCPRDLRDRINSTINRAKGAKE